MFTKLINPFEDLFDEFFSEHNLTNNKMIQKCKSNINFPRHNITTNEKEVKIELAVPGYTEEQLNVNIEKNMLIVEGTSKQETEDNTLAHEIKSSYFKKSYELIDENLSKENIKCKLEYGILSIIIPKITEDKKLEKVKRIQI